MWFPATFVSGTPREFYLVPDGPADPSSEMDRIIQSAQQRHWNFLEDSKMEPGMVALLRRQSVDGDAAEPLEDRVAIREKEKLVRVLVEQILAEEQEASQGKVLVRLLDEGRCLVVTPAELMRMPLALAKFPPRAVKCRLASGSSEAKEDEGVNQLFEAILTSSTQLYFQPSEEESYSSGCIRSDFLTVHLRCHHDPGEILQQWIRLQPKEEACPEVLPLRRLRSRMGDVPFDLPFPALVSYRDEEEDDKKLFHIIPVDELSLSSEALDLDKNLSTFCSSSRESPPLQWKTFCPGTALAVRINLSTWQRGEFVQTTDDLLLIVRMVDSGKMENVSPASVFPLPEAFFALPKLAIPIRLIGHEPTNLNWDEELMFVRRESETGSSDGVMLLELDKGDGEEEEKEEVDCPAIEEDVFAEWNPMESAFNTPSLENPLGLPSKKHGGFELDADYSSGCSDDLGLQVKLCRFFAETGCCFRKAKCPDLHRYTATPAAASGGGYALTVNECEVPRPKKGSLLLAQVASVVNPVHFYCIFPRGTRCDLEQLDPDALDPEDEEESLESLSIELDDFYEHSTPPSHSMLMQIGQMVAVKWRDGCWYRARFLCEHKSDQYEEVVDGEEEEDSGVIDPETCFGVSVFLVDYGCTEAVTWASVRELDVRFLKLPFQAVNCHLMGIAPASTDNGLEWGDASTQAFCAMSRKRDLLLHVVDNEDPESLGVELVTLDMKVNLGQGMVDQGLAIKDTDK